MKDLSIRTTKFPYFFWSFNKSYNCRLDFVNGNYENLDKNTHYTFEEMNFFLFLALKYAPILLILCFTFNLGDLPTSKETIVSYMFAVSLVLLINLLDNFLRKIGIVMLLALCIFTSFIIENYYLTAYCLKYFVFLSVVLIFYLDLKTRAFNLIQNDKVVSNFLIHKENL